MYDLYTQNDDLDSQETTPNWKNPRTPHILHTTRMYAGFGDKNFALIGINFGKIA